jgi:hypothetical protein
MLTAYQEAPISTVVVVYSHVSMKYDAFPIKNTPNLISTGSIYLSTTAIFLSYCHRAIDPVIN